MIQLKLIKYMKLMQINNTFHYKMSEETESCFICAGDADEEEFLEPHPCKCKGSLKIHWSCFQELATRSEICSTCNSPFNIGGSLLKVFYPDGKIKEKYYALTRNNIKHGQSLTYYPNGTIMIITNYFQGTITGYFHKYYPSGRLMIKATYFSGYKHDIYREYYDNSEHQLKYECYYLYNAKQGVEYKYYENGRINTRTTYKVGNREGSFESFYPSGSPDIKAHYSFDRYHGDFIKFYSNGVIAAKAQYNYGTPIGEYIRYNKLGEIIAPSNPMPVLSEA